ncbi:hypothetical protein CAEBREN_04762 [Caenorhabditis brenneri]|uniref:Tc3 transposase DNA binding domain-containing protein n=1 Tax=Caenorhabditis brenneri TaxID=135651 RepID=G0P3E2_CAEBE|nr:hypothetical protein CAEBREN_04762 [Caenorhabditis brenneri]
MGRAALLSHAEQAKVDVMRQMGTSLHEMARLIQKSRSAIRRYMNDPLNYGKKVKESKGRPRKMDSRTERNIIRTISNSPKSINDVRGELNLQVSKNTVRNVLQRSGVIVQQKMTKVPRMIGHHKTARLDFVKKNLTTKWDLVSVNRELIF